MTLRLRAPSLPRRKILRRPPVQGPLVLEIVRGRVKRRMRPVKGPVFLVGAASDCDLVLGDPRFPDAYAYIYVRSDGVSIRYLGAGPVLEVDGSTVENSPLHVGSVVTAGPFEFVVHRDDDFGDGHDDDTELEFAPQTPHETEDSAALDIVRALLTEVRRKLFPQPAPLAAFRRRASAKEFPVSAVAQVIGVIETRAPAIPAEVSGGDIDLGDTLARLAGKVPADNLPEPIRRRSAPLPRTAVVTADTVQLVADLEADFERLIRTQQPIYLPAS